MITLPPPVFSVIDTGRCFNLRRSRAQPLHRSTGWPRNLADLRCEVFGGHHTCQAPQSDIGPFGPPNRCCFLDGGSGGRLLSVHPFGCGLYQTSFMPKTFMGPQLVGVKSK